MHTSYLRHTFYFFTFFQFSISFWNYFILTKHCKDSRVPTYSKPFPPLLTSYVRMVHLLQLMSRYWSVIIGPSRPYSCWLSFHLSTCSVWWSRPGYQAPFGRHVPWGSSWLWPLILVWDDLDSFEECWLSVLWGAPLREFDVCFLRPGFGLLEDDYCGSLPGDGMASRVRAVNTI